MIVKGDTGFGLIFIAYLLFFGLCFLVIDLVLKKLLKGSIKTMVLLEAVIVLLLLLATLYIEFKKSKREPPNFHVEPVVKKL